MGGSRSLALRMSVLAIIPTRTGIAATRVATCRDPLIRADLAAHRAEVGADLAVLDLRLIKWIVGTGVAVAVAVLAGVRLLLL